MYNIVNYKKWIFNKRNCTLRKKLLFNVEKIKHQILRILKMEIINYF